MTGFSCAVPGCANNTVKHRHLSFHKFPKDAELLQKWLKNIKRRGTEGRFSEFKPTKNHRICSEHFAGGKKTYMNRVPTIFPLIKKKEQAKRKSRTSQGLRLPLVLNLPAVADNSAEEDCPQQCNKAKDTRLCVPDHLYTLQSDPSDTAALEKMLKEKIFIIENMACEIQDLHEQVHKSQDQISNLQSELRRCREQNKLLIQQRELVRAKSKSLMKDLKNKMTCVKP